MSEEAAERPPAALLNHSHDLKTTTSPTTVKDLELHGEDDAAAPLISLIYK